MKLIYGIVKNALENNSWDNQGATNFYFENSVVLADLNLLKLKYWFKLLLKQTLIIVNKMSSALMHIRELVVKLQNDFKMQFCHGNIGTTEND